MKRLVLAVGAWLALAGAARADDYVTIRGAYYREPSTRVIQPTVQVERDDVASGLDVKAHFLVDTITSASVAAGTTVDNIFTETRNEVGLDLRKRWARTEATLGYKYSAESDYWSHALSGGVSRRLWGDTGRLSLALGLGHDVASTPTRTPYCATPPSHACSLDNAFVGVGYTQVFSPIFLAQASLESSYLTGFQSNLYRAVPNRDYERLPGTRLRNAVATRFALYLRPTGTVLRFQYRYYRDLRPCDVGGSPCDGGGDPWGVASHTLEGRVYQPLGRTLEVRLSYRQYFQSKAGLWRDVAAGDFYPQSAIYYSTDPKLGPVRTEYPEVKVFWLADALTDVPVLSWFAAGTFDVSYGYYIQDTSFQNAHLLQLGYTMPY